MSETNTFEELIVMRSKNGDGTIYRQRPLVRCMDCKHGSLYCTEDCCGETLIECNHPELGDNIAIHAWDWFCANGEQRSE